MNRIQTKALVEGAILAGIMALIGIISFYIPFISVMSLVWAVPIIIVGYRNGLKVSIISALTAGALVSLLTQPLNGIGLFISYGLPGIFMGYMLRSKRYSPTLVVLATAVVLAVCTAISSALFLMISGQNLTTLFNETGQLMKEAMAQTVQIYKQFGIDEKTIQQMMPPVDEMLALTKLLIPLMLLFSGAIFSFINFKLARIVLSRVRYEIEDIKPFSEWQIPKEWVFALILSIFVMFVAMQFFSTPQLTAVITNLIWMLIFVFGIIGLSVASFYLKKYAVPKFLRITILFVAAMGMMHIAMYVGIIDAVFNIRKLKIPERGGA